MQEGGSTVYRLPVWLRGWGFTNITFVQSSTLGSGGMYTSKSDESSAAGKATLLLYRTL